MIAPLRKPTRGDSPATSIVRARRLVASMLFPHRQRRRSAAVSHHREGTRLAGPPAWQAWLFALWVVVVVAAYFASMLGQF